MVLVARRTQPSPAEPSRAQPKRASPAVAAAPRPRRPPPSGSSASLPGKPPDHARCPTRFCDPPAPRSSERLQSSRRYARHAGERGGGEPNAPTQRERALPSPVPAPRPSPPAPPGLVPCRAPATKCSFPPSPPSLRCPDFIRTSWCSSQRLRGCLHPAFSSSCSFEHPPASGPLSALGAPSESHG